jgi:hypothetical protein
MHFDFLDYLHLNDNQILKMKLKGRDEWIFVRRVSQEVLQPFQIEATEITKINLEVIKDIELFRLKRDDYDSYFEIRVEPEEIEDYELI